MNRVRHAVLGAAAAAMVMAVLAQPPIRQDPVYHNLADCRCCVGVPNCLDVLSNLPFAVVGALGLATIFRRGNRGPALFRDPWERWPYATLFTGTALIAVGSTWYHLAPDNGRLVWDRLPMTVAFMGLLTAVATERLGVAAGRRSLGPLIAIGAASIAYWYWGELRGEGDLRPYVLVQFGSLAAVVLMLVLYPARYPGAVYLAGGLCTYALAKGFEAADQAVFALTHVVSGHTLKHIVAAAAVACLVAMLRMRARATGDLEADATSDPSRPEPSKPSRAPGGTPRTAP